MYGSSLAPIIEYLEQIMKDVLALDRCIIYYVNFAPNILAQIYPFVH